MSKLHLFLVTYFSHHSLTLPVSAHSDIWFWLVSISDESSLPEIALSGASKLASTYFTLFYRSVHVLYSEWFFKSRFLFGIGSGSGMAQVEYPVVVLNWFLTVFDTCPSKVSDFRESKPRFPVRTGTGSRLGPSDPAS